MRTWLRSAQGDSVLKPTYTHNHTGGIKSDGSCPRCNSYAEALADDMDQYEPDAEIEWHVNTESTMQIMQTPKQDWYPES